MTVSLAMRRATGLDAVKIPQISQLAESKLSHTFYKFYIHTLSLCKFWLEMKGLSVIRVFSEGKAVLFDFLALQ